MVCTPVTPPDSRSVLPPYTVGLTGGIASGKSTVARAFHALGVCIIDADQISRDLTAPGQPLLAAMVAEWGDAILSENGTLNRGHLRSIIFADPEARARLNAMSHPLIRAEMFARARACADPYVILEIPLLVEGGLQNQVDRVLVVECPAALRIERLCARDGITQVQAQAILDAQARDADRLAVADDVLPNTQSPSQLAESVLALHKHYLELASRR